MFTGMKKDCLSVLKDGSLVSISPGGVREALFSDDTYKIMWCNRTGFAQVAIDAKVVSAKKHMLEQQVLGLSSTLAE